MVGRIGVGFKRRSAQNQGIPFYNYLIHRYGTDAAGRPWQVSPTAKTLRMVTEQSLSSQFSHSPASPNQPLAGLRPLPPAAGRTHNFVGAGQSKEGVISILALPTILWLDFAHSHLQRDAPTTSSGQVNLKRG
jgi:hypothetical protein